MNELEKAWLKARERRGFTTSPVVADVELDDQDDEISPELKRAFSWKAYLVP